MPNKKPVPKKILKKLASIGRELKDTSAKVKKNGNMSFGADRLLLESERKEVLDCKKSHCLFWGEQEGCEWMRTTRSTRKCKISTRSHYELGVDGDKIKYRVTQDERQLKKKIRQYSKIAKKIDDEVNKREAAQRKIILKQRLRAVVDKLRVEKKEGMELMEDAPKTRYSWLKSLV